MQVSNLENLGFRAPEVATFYVEQVPDDEDAWAEQLADLHLVEVLGFQAANTSVEVHEVRYGMTREPSSELGRDWWAGDHLWHVDGTPWEIQPAFTVIGCHQAEEGAPGTELLDTVHLFQITLQDGFWPEHGIAIDDLLSIKSVFAFSTYQREAMPFLRTMMSPVDRRRAETQMAKDLQRKGHPNLGSLVAEMDAEDPPKSFDLVQQTPVSGHDSLFIDAGVRNSTLVGAEGQDLKPVLHDLRWRYLTGDQPRELGLVRRINWEPGKCVIFPQVGTLHRAMPGNEQHRVLQLGFLYSDLQPER